MRKMLVLVLFISGCGGGATAPEPKTFDLGLAAPSSMLPPVRIAAVRAIAPFDATDMQYRLAYRNAAEISAFANSRWAATPAEMLRKQLLRAANDAPGKCSLDIELQEFSQVFSAKDLSVARIEMRVLLGQGANSVSRQFTLVEGNAGAGAESGAVAFARAANHAIGELAGWIAARPDCR